MRYTVILEREDDGGYIATVPALPGCVSQGDTREEVMRNIHEAADVYIEDCIAAAMRDLSRLHAVGQSKLYTKAVERFCFPDAN